MTAKMTLTASLGLICVACYFAISTTYAQIANPRDSSETAHKAQDAAKDANDTASEDSNQVAAFDPNDPAKPKDFWMEQKLRLSKGVLTGLVSSDFEAIGKNAEIMRGLNRVEAFVRRRTEGYRDELKQFDMANKALIQASQDENLDGATLAFNQLTISCVNCHKQLREEDDAE